MENFEYITLSKAAKICPMRPSTNVVWRWCRRGLTSRSGEKVYLRHVRIGRKIFTTANWLRDFFNNVAWEDLVFFKRNKNHSHKNLKKKNRNGNPRNVQIEEAYRELSDDGI